MKVVIFSDAHGERLIVDRILAFNPDADYLLSLGDSGLPKDYLAEHKIIHVKGNIIGDYGKRYEHVLDLNGKKIFMTHGHKYKVHYNLMKLKYHGLANQYDIILFGHTHTIYHQMVENMLMLNPGSCKTSRNHLSPSYVILTINGKTVTYSYRNARTNEKMEV